MKQKLRLFSTLLLLAVVSATWGDSYVQLTSIANIDESAQYVLGIDGTGFHYEGTSSWGKTALPSVQTPIYYTLTKASDGNSFTAKATISGTTYYLQVPTSNTFSMATSAGTNTDLIIGTTQVSETNYAVANKTTTARHLRINGTSGLRSYAGATGTMAYFYKVVADGAVITSTTINVPADFNTDVHTSTTAGQLTATVSANGTAISGATVSWESSNEGVATIDASGKVTLVAAGTTTITATYAGVEGQYEGSSATYTFTVIDSTPFEGGDVTFDATEDKGTSPLIKNGVSFSCTNGVLNNGTEYRLYKNSTTTISTTSGKITKIEFTGVSGNPVSGFGETIGLTTSGNNGTWTGNATSVNFTASGAQVRVSKIVVTVASADAVTAPVISGTTPFLGSTEVTITAEEGATIYYTTNGDEPTASSTQYSAPFTLEASATVKAIAVKDGKTSEVAEKAFEVVTPMTVAQALEATAPIEDVFVQGVVSTVTEVSTEHGNATYRISDDGTTEGEMIVYRGKYVNNTDFTNENQIQVGDAVVITGNLTVYNGANQLAAGNYIVTLTTKQEPGIAYETTEYTVAPSATFETPKLTNPHNLAVTYSISENEGVASIDATTGAVTIGTEEGSVTVTATFAGNNQYRAGSASYIIRVSDPNKGTEANPYTVADVIAGKADGKTEIYVIGYIVGEFNSKTQDPRTSGFTTDANIALADEFTSTPTAAASIPVALPTSALKTEWGCKTNEGSTIGTQVLVKGNGDTYFSVNGIKNTTEVTAVAIPVTISAAGMATFCSDKALDFSQSESVYAYKAVISGTQVNLTKVAKVPAQTGVLLRSVSGGEVVASIPVTTGVEAITDNAFVAVMTEITSLPTETTEDGVTYVNYILNKVNGVTDFYKANGKKVGANKAYLRIDKATASKGISIGYADETDGIHTIGNEPQKVDGIYNLSGQRVNKAQKGIYIVNGKKVVIR